ncbi:uncharacterized protein LOC105648715 isoform X2 [Jatropha curcas]|uniref:uncharacterized protein LOC105648715 isoform X2 n=1 Tax=Jatropha curcas TaxID=180498 RepID=UPI00189309D2|nr:uncharacterized protein LOC105648715 isoform X2 [Jatropha curcas]
MSAAPPIFKKPKVEQDGDGEELVENAKSMAEQENGGEGEEGTSREEQEEALVALIEHRTKEVEHLKKRISYYKSQLQEAEKRLEDTEARLARLRGKSNSMSSKASQGNGTKSLKMEGSRSISPIHVTECSSENQSQSRTELLIPAASPKIFQPIKSSGSVAKASGVSSTQSSPSIHISKVKAEKSYRSSPDVEERGTKRKHEPKEIQKEHKELIPLLRSSTSPCTIRCYTNNHIPSQHKRKLRSLALCPVNDKLFVTSALDGMIHLWEVQSRGSGASLLSSTDCMSSKHRRWPEDIVWHPSGNSLFSVYSADGGDSQISILNLNKTQGARVTYLEDKPHLKGIINSIVFTPWDNACFATGGSDHAVILWNEKDDISWKPKALHRNMHSSAVMGVAGLQQKHIVLSAGADKRIIGFDVQVGRADFKHQLDNKCMSVLPNPCDFNLFMVQTGTPEKQLRLFDIRLRQTELHSFGFKQESSDSQSALINQAWSPDGLYLTSGSVDPVIHVFDIRYNSNKPSQSIRAHQKRVFKAVWHYSLPLMISISSDLHIGLHKIT